MPAYPRRGPGSSQASIFDLRPGTLILEPARGGGLYRLLMRGRGIEHLTDPQYDLTAREALYFIFAALGHEFGLTAEDILRDVTIRISDPAES